MIQEKQNVNQNTEIRHILDSYHMSALFQILEQNDGWKRLMSEIRLKQFDINDDNFRFTYDDIKTIENAGKESGRFCTEIFLEEWATSGKKRPTVKLLIDYLAKLELWRAFYYITVNILNEESTEHSLNFSSPVSDNRNSVQDDDDNNEKEVFIGIREILGKYKHLKQISYEKIKAATNNFGIDSKLGKGGYGTVYFSKIDNENLAVKVLNSFTIKHFANELTILSQSVNHPNLLPPVGVSFGPSTLCIIYPFMSNGSLEDRLALRIKKKLLLTWQKRISISFDIIQGLEYLHNSVPIVIHRDIKSSNILLDYNDGAKISDFGLVRVKSPNDNSINTTSVKGTDAYMAPEVYIGNITTKADIYSYGMVILELITGLPILRNISDAPNHLMYYVEEKLKVNGMSYLNQLLDEKAGNWDLDIVDKLYFIATQCLILDYKLRPTSDEVRSKLEELDVRIENTEVL